jgi:hypothetical protein
MCIDYRKQHKATQKDHFPLPFIDQMLERLAKHSYFCYLDGYSGFFQIPIYPTDQENTKRTSNMKRKINLPLFLNVVSEMPVSIGLATQI